MTERVMTNMLLALDTLEDELPEQLRVHVPRAYTAAGWCQTRFAILGFAEWAESAESDQAALFTRRASGGPLTASGAGGINARPFSWMREVAMIF